MIESIQRIKQAITSVFTEIVESIALRSGGSTTRTYRDPIDFKHADNQDLVSFLRVNNNKIVFLDTYIDVHVADSKYIEAIGQGQSESDAEIFSSFSALSLPLSYSQGTCVTAMFFFYENCILKYSAEKDLFRFEIKGCFQIACAVHGWTAVFQLTEVKTKEEVVRTF